MSPEEYAEVEKLKARIKELEIEVSNAYDGTQLMQGYEQCLQDLQGVTDGVMEVTWMRGPAEGLTYLLERLRGKDVDTHVPFGVPYDWLSRWREEDVA